MGTSSLANCDLLTICQSCNAAEDPYECCYWDGGKREGCTLNTRPFHLDHLILKSPAWLAQLSDVYERVQNVISSVRLAGAQSLHFPFIPEVKLDPKDRSRSLAIIRRMDVPIIAVSLAEFYDGIRARQGMAQAQKRGLSDYLDFGGRILLTTDVPDKLCEHFLRYPSRLKFDIEQLDPTYVTTPDTSTYYNVPAAVSLWNIYRTISVLDELADLRSRFVGLALGSNTPQLLWHAKALLAMGCNILATPLYELRRSGNDELARHRLDKLRSLGSKVLALSCSPSRGSRLLRADYYSSWSWSELGVEGEDLEIGMEKLARFVRSSRNEASQEVLV